MCAPTTTTYTQNKPVGWEQRPIEIQKYGKKNKKMAAHNFEHTQTSLTTIVCSSQWEDTTPTYPKYHWRRTRSVGKMSTTKREATSESPVSRPVRQSCPSALVYHQSHPSAPSTSPSPLAVARGRVNGCPRLRELERYAPFVFVGSPRIRGRKGEGGRPRGRMRLPWSPTGRTRTNELVPHVW